VPPPIQPEAKSVQDLGCLKVWLDKRRSGKKSKLPGVADLTKDLEGKTIIDYIEIVLHGPLSEFVVTFLSWNFDTCIQLERVIENYLKKNNHKDRNIMTWVTKELTKVMCRDYSNDLEENYHDLIVTYLLNAMTQKTLTRFTKIMTVE